MKTHESRYDQPRAECPESVKELERDSSQAGTDRDGKKTRALGLSSRHVEGTRTPSHSLYNGGLRAEPDGLDHGPPFETGSGPHGSGTWCTCRQETRSETGASRPLRGPRVRRQGSGQENCCLSVTFATKNE